MKIMMNFIYSFKIPFYVMLYMFNEMAKALDIYNMTFLFSILIFY